MKGFFTQGVAILTAQPVTLDELRPLLSEYRILRTVEPSNDWQFGGATTVVAYREEVNGLVTIDTVDRPWPDGMGDQSEPALFGGRSMGFFGPFAYPGGLRRAAEQAWGWPEAKTLVPQHRAFLRIRTSYVLGAQPDAPSRPSDCDPRHELDFVMGLAQRLLKHPAALCYFNPNGEVVASANKLRDFVDFYRKRDLPPLDVLSNVRLFNLTPDWLLMDSVGCWQLDIPDHEAAFPAEKFEPKDVALFLRNAAFYVLASSREIRDNDTMDGPGDVRWQAVRFSDSITDPPREVLCWVPVGSESVPEQVTNRKLAAETS
jgi:hypothetical protein